MSEIKPHLEWDTLIKGHGAQLPHWTCNRAIYHIVFRLFNSLPKDVLEQWSNERKAIVNKARAMDRSLSDHEEQRLSFLYSRLVERYLDQGKGPCWLKRPAIAELVQKALLIFHEERYVLHCWCIMPNHVHVIIEPEKDFQLHSIKHSWLSFTAKQANAILQREGQFWQHEPYDHIIRSFDEYRFLVDYVLSNPDKAGLMNWCWRGIARSSPVAP